jgi:hypothetical protein
MRRSGNDKAAGEHPARWPSVAGVVLIAAVPVATWWAVGDLSTDLPDPDYQIRPFDIGPTAEQVAGVSATVLAAAAVVALIHAGRAGRFDRRWWPVLVELVLAGALCGAGWRVLTAGVIGANIGAGLVLWVGAPMVAALVGLAVFDWLSVRAQRQHPGTKR